MNANNEAVPVPFLKFTHHGIERTLVKHPAYVRALKDGQMTLADFKFKPWTLRFEIDGSDKKFKLSPVDKDAIRQAKDILNGQRDKPAEFVAWLHQRDAKRSVTLGELAKEWRELKLPDHNGRPRDHSAIDNMEVFLSAALKWWADIPAGIASTKFADFIAWRRAQAVRGTGERAADLELNALSALCRWAVFACKIEDNPFRGRKQGGHRPRFRSPDDVKHCHESMPASDEELHSILQWFWQQLPAPTSDRPGSETHKAAVRRHALEEKRRFIAGAWLCFCSLSGLRPGEPAFLLKLPSLDAVPPNLKQLEPGQIFPTRDGRLVMKAQRGKGGQNPYIQLHPVLRDFLAVWNLWLDTLMPGAKFLFPDPEQPQSALGVESFLHGMLERACRACKAPVFRPHGFGRAYFVRVRRSQGADDSTIAVELGQTTNGKLIREIYGDPEDMVGGAVFDWLPADEKQKPLEPAWTLLRSSIPSNILSISSGRA